MKTNWDRQVREHLAQQPRAVVVVAGEHLKTASKRPVFAGLDEGKVEEGIQRPRRRMASVSVEPWKGED